MARAFTHVEDAVYLGLGLLLAAGAIALLIATGVDFIRSVLAGRVVALLDQILLIFMIVEILYTVQVSFMVIALVVALVLLRKRAPTATADKA